MRTPIEEWRPHAVRSESTIEWYLASLTFDASGHPHFIVWCIFNFAGSNYLRQGVPVRPGHRLVSVPGGFPDHDRGQHSAAWLMAVLSGESMWDEDADLLRLDTPDCKCSWSFTAAGVDLMIASPEPYAHIHLDGVDKVMWAKNIFGTGGLVQEDLRVNRASIIRFRTPA